MNDIIDIRVAPYALHDTIKALEQCCDKNEYMDITVTKEDYDLHIRYRKVVLPKSNPMSTAGCLARMTIQEVPNSNGR